ncbi:MAG: basic amino acid ABC transporter substrate-binding protein [Herpetosiphonaceae bacterium]|nr:basic amino acid ABC transporter substrate-binding protein [Herpetosiphonaceae bacterium]
MKRMTTWLMALVLTSLLAACGGTYTTTRQIDSMGTTAPTSVASSTLGAGTTGATSAATDASTAAAMTMTSGATLEASATAMDTMTAGSTAASATALETMTSGATMASTTMSTTGTMSAMTSTAMSGTTGVTGTAMTTLTPVADLKGRAVVVGSDTTYPPFESIDKTSNKIVGFDPDLMAMIGQLINIKPEFKTANFDTIFTALAAKQYDAVMSAVTITDDRKKQVDFSDPYVTIGQRVVALKSNSAIKSYTDLKSNNYKVGVQRGTTGEKAALEKAGVSDANVKRYDDIAAAFADLKNNAIDAIVADGPTVGNYGEQATYKDVVAVVGDAFTTEDYGIAIPKGDTELQGAINKALAALKQAGKIDELKNTYKIK